MEYCLVELDVAVDLRPGGGRAIRAHLRQRCILMSAGVVESELLAILWAEDVDRRGRVETEGVSAGRAGQWARDVLITLSAT